MIKQKQPKPNAWQVLVSVLGALFGVQSSRVYERDFTRGRAWWVYGLVGVFVVMLLVLLLFLLAKFIISNA
jgi:hypothetical protein